MRKVSAALVEMFPKLLLSVMKFIPCTGKINCQKHDLYKQIAICFVSNSINMEISANV